MPEISRFLGIIIVMYWKEHGIPHFHAKYGDFRASISIEHTGLLEGRLPPRVMGLVIEWAVAHRDALMDDWTRAAAGKALRPIRPLE